MTEKFRFEGRERNGAIHRGAGMCCGNTMTTCQSDFQIYVQLIDIAQEHEIVTIVTTFAGLTGAINVS